MTLRNENKSIAFRAKISARRKFHLRALAAGLSLCGFSRGAIVAADTPAPEVECLLVSGMKNGFLELTAIVRSKSPVSGSYALIVNKHSQSGDSENAQSGAFSLASDRERILTTTLLDQGAVGHYRAKLSIVSDLGRASCASP